MPTRKDEPKTVITGGGAHIKNLSTQGGEVVFGDQVKTVYQQQGASGEDLLKLLAELRTLLPQAGLAPVEAEAIESDFRVIEEQATKDQPKASLIKAKLKGIAALIQDAGKTSDAVEKMLKLLGKGAVVAGTLF